jgi:uncharacterized protein (TIGR00255 family)
MKSMTGFGYSEYQDDSVHITVEIKAYNNRYLDVLVNLPSYLSPLEPRVRSYITDGVARGRVEVTVKVRELRENIDVILDEKAAKSYIHTLKQLAAAAGVDETMYLSRLADMDGVLKLEKNRDLDSFWIFVRDRLEEAYARFETSRVEEGRQTKNDIVKLCTRLSEAHAEIIKYAGEMESKLKETLVGRFQEMLNDQLDENRILAETAVMLVKYGINEELTRLGGHLETFEREIESEGPCGKRLDFLCQELNREINTIGSKSIMMNVNELVIRMKDSTENIREQLRNIE